MKRKWQIDKRYFKCSPVSFGVMVCMANAELYSPTEIRIAIGHHQWIVIVLRPKKRNA